MCYLAQLFRFNGDPNVASFIHTFPLLTNQFLFQRPQRRRLLLGIPSPQNEWVKQIIWRSRRCRIDIPKLQTFFMFTIYINIKVQWWLVGMVEYFHCITLGIIAFFRYLCQCCCCCWCARFTTITPSSWPETDQRTRKVILVPFKAAPHRQTEQPPTISRSSNI